MEEPVLELRHETKVIAGAAIGRAGVGKEGAVFRDAFTGKAYLVNVVGLGKLVISFGEKTAYCGEEFGTLFLGKFGVKGVNGNVDGPPVGFECKNIVHDFGGGRTKGGAIIVEVFEVGFIHGVSYDFNVEVIHVCCRKTISEVRSCGGTV